MFDNEANKSTGGQNTYQKHLDYVNIAKNSGLEVYEEVITSLDDFESVVEKSNTTKGLKFICVKCGFDAETPRPPLKKVRVNKL